MARRPRDPRPLLAAARAEQLLVRVHRRGDLAPFEGYVVGLGARWVALAAVDDTIRLSGWTALRLRDVRSVEPRRTAGFVEGALRWRGQWPPREPPVPLDLATRRGLLTGLVGTGRLVALHPEPRDPDVCFVGVVRRVGEHWVHLQEVSPSAEWDPRPTRHALRELTRIDLEGEYEQALRAVAGPAPA